MNAEINAKAKSAMHGILNDVADTLNEYVDAINNDKLDWESTEAMIVVGTMMDMMVAVNGHMYVDRLDDLDAETVKKVAERLAKATMTKDLVKKALDDSEEE